MLVYRVPPRGVDPDALRGAADVLRAGGIVAFPTETVYGLGVSSEAPEGPLRLAQLKGRPAGKPFSYHLASVEQVLDLVGSVPPLAKTLMDRYFPGPMTLVLPLGEGVERRTIGVRVPANEIAQKLIELAGAPLLVPSANPSGDPPAISAEDVLRYFGDRIDAIVDGGTVQLKQASTVVRVDENGYEVLREGIITREMVHQCLEGRRILFVCTGNTCRSPMAAEMYRKQLAARLGESPEDLSELGYRILSAGTQATRGSPASDYAHEAILKRGGDLSRHLSQPVTAELLAEVDHVYALGHSNLQVLERMLREMEGPARPRVSMLNEEGVSDPVGGDFEAYDQCADAIEAAIERILPG